MMFRSSVITALFLMSTSVQAQTVTVRSGEHADFTRLVIPRAASAPWQVERSATNVTIRFEGPPLALDTSRVFQLIPRTRLADVSAGPSSLQLSLNCDCAVETSVYAGTYLVLDIKDGSPIVGEALPQLMYRFSQFGGERLQDWPNRVSATLGNVSEPVFPAIPPASIQSVIQIPRASELETVLYDQNVVRLLEAGAFFDSEFHTGMQDAANRNLVTMEGEAIENLMAPDGMSDIVIARNLADHIATSSSVIPELETIFAPEPTCVKDTEFWPEDPEKLDSFAKSIGQLRRNVAREDATAADAKKLAKALLFFGFGAEARQVAQTRFPESKTSEIISVIADVVDRGYSPDGTLLQHQLDCEGLIPIWAYLAHRDPSSVSSSTGFAAVAAAFSTLPSHLRAHLGPFAIERLANAGHPARAEQIQRLMDAATGGDDAPMLADATLKEGLGDSEGAQAVIETLASGNYPDSVLAMPKLVAARAKDLAPMTPEEIDLLDSFVTEYKGASIEVDLVHAQALAYGLDGRFDDAMILMTEHDLKSAGDLFDLLSKIGSDIDLLQHILPNTQLAQAFWLDDRSLQSARRLLDLGFAQEVFTYLINPFSGEAEDVRRLLRAEAALDLRDPAAALRILRGASGDDADLLRAKAYEMSEGAADAQLLYARLGADQDANRIQFRAAGPAALDETVEASVDNAELTDLSEDTPPAGRYGQFNRSIAGIASLARTDNSEEVTTSLAGDLRRQSAETRALIETLLQESALGQ